MELKNKTALITDCMSPAGKAIARELAKHGVDLVLCAKDDQGLEDFNAEISKINEDISVFIQQVNFSDVDEILNLVEQTKSFFPVIDILIFNTSVIQSDLFENISTEQWDMAIDSNLKSAYLLMKSLVPAMIAQKSGFIVSVASLNSKSPTGGDSLYSAIYFGLRGLILSLKEEVRKDNIQVSLVNIIQEKELKEVGTDKIVTVVLHVLTNSQNCTIDELDITSE